MKIQNLESASAIAAALSQMGVRLFQLESGDATTNAERNLAGRSYYYSADTRRFHKSKVLGSSHDAGGLLFSAICSDAADMHGTRRVFRRIWHDVFGTTISREKLEDAATTRRGAEKLDDAKEFDLLAHYRAAIAKRVQETESAAAKTKTAQATISAI